MPFAAAGRRYLPRIVVQMIPEKNLWGMLWGLVCILFGLLTPALVVYDIYLQWHTPAVDFVVDWETGVIRNVPENSYADYAGFWVNDKIISVGGVAFNQWFDLLVGNQVAEIERYGQVIEMELPVIPLLKTNLLPMMSGAFVALAFWGISAALLVRRYQQVEIRIIFLLGQAMAIALLFPMAHPDYWTSPTEVRLLSIIALLLSAPLVLQYAISFPVRLGSKRQRFWSLGLAYLFALAAMAAWLASYRVDFDVGRRIGIFYVLSVISAALVVMGYVYLRRAAPDERRQLRVVVLSTILAGLPALIFYLLPNFIGMAPRIPVWLAGLLVSLAPLSYLYATARHNLFGIDRLLNRT